MKKKNLKVLETGVAKIICVKIVMHKVVTVNACFLLMERGGN